MAVLHHMNKAQLPKHVTAAGKLDVVHLIVVGWALLFHFILPGTILFTLGG